MPDPLVALPGLVRQHREALGLSLHELARLSGLSVSALSALERARVANPRASTLLQLGHALGLAPSALLGDAAARPAVSAAEMEVLVCLRRRFTPRDQSEPRQ